MANQIFNGNWIILSGVKIEGLNSQTLHKKKLNSKIWGYNEGILQEILLEILKKIIPNKVNEKNIIDIPLNVYEIKSLKSFFEEEVKKLLNERMVSDSGFEVEILNQIILLDLRNNRKTDSLLYGYFNMLKIIDECIEANNPLYLTID